MNYINILSVCKQNPMTYETDKWKSRSTNSYVTKWSLHVGIKKELYTVLKMKFIKNKNLDGKRKLLSSFKIKWDTYIINCCIPKFLIFFLFKINILLLCFYSNFMRLTFKYIKGLNINIIQAKKKDYLWKWKMNIIWEKSNKKAYKTK